MNWYAAHVILYVQFKERPQNHFPVWENVILLKARNETQAYKKAEKRGREEEGDDDGSFHWQGRAARWVFAGVRKVTLCQEAEKRPDDGTEISYQELQLDSKAALEKLVAGQEVTVRLADEFAAPRPEARVG